MPPKAKFTRQEIVDSAFKIVQRDGVRALSARNLALELGSSPRPIFTVFKNMEELLLEVDTKAYNLFKDYVILEIKNHKYPPYKSVGIAYIKYAVEQQNLFRMMFLNENNRKRNIKEELNDSFYINLVRETLNLSYDDAKSFHLHMWLFVHGISSVLAYSLFAWDEEFVSKMVTNSFLGFSSIFVNK